jgi:ankyrin repeat protein
MVQLLRYVYPESLHRANNDGWLPLHGLCSNQEIDEEAGLEILKFLLERCPESVRHATNNGNLPIHRAAAYQSPEFCRILIEAYPGSERMPNGSGSLPFHWACLNNIVATVKYLYKLYPESISVADNNELYPIHYVMDGLREGDDPEVAVEVVKFLLDCNTDVALQKHQNEFPFYFFCREATSDNTPKLNAYLEILQLLYDAYPDAVEENTIASDFGFFCQEVQSYINTQLAYARQARDHRVITTPDESGQLPLHVALRDNVTLGSIKLLVKGNPSATRNFDDRGMIPLHVACQHHHSPSVVEYMIGLRSSALEMEDRWQHTLLHFACRGANHVMIAFLLDKYDAAFVSTRNSSNQLPIDLLFDSEAVSDREGIEYMESIYRLIRANPETVMGCNMNMNERQQAQSEEIGKKRKVAI